MKHTMTFHGLGWLAHPKARAGSRERLKRYLGVWDQQKPMGGSATTLNIYIDSLLRTFYGKYIKFGSDKGISKRIAVFLRLVILDSSRGELDYSHGENQISQSENGWVIFWLRLDMCGSKGDVRNAGDPLRKLN